MRPYTTAPDPSAWDNVTKVDVSSRRAPIGPCEVCGGMRKLTPHPHAPRFVEGLQVDCGGMPV